MPRSVAVPRSAFAALAATDSLLAAAGPAARRVRWLSKPLLMPTLTVGLLGAGTEDAAVRRTLAAQVLCWGGDVALLGSGRRPFLAGLGSFLAGHVAYTAAFRSLSPAPVLSTRSGRAALAAGAVLAPTMATAAGRSDPRLAGPVATYGAVLATMVAASAAVPDDRHRARILSGTALFLLSDALLGTRTFVLRERHAAVDAAVMATYTAALWLIRDGVARACSNRAA